MKNNVYIRHDGKRILKFKDTIIGKDEKLKLDENQVVLEIPGMELYYIKVSNFFFSMLNEKGISTHMVSSDAENNTMRVKGIIPLPIKCVSGLIDKGSHIRKSGKFLEEGKDLEYLFEITVKDCEDKNTTNNEDKQFAYNLLYDAHHQNLKKLTQDITCIIKKFLEEKGIVLYYMELEFGLDVNSKIMLIGEISANSMICYKNGEKLDSIELSKLIIGIKTNKRLVF